MEERQKKTPSQSRTEQVHLLMPGHLNGADRLFGGRLMEWIDVVAAVAARRHSQRQVTTASVDSLQFRQPAYGGEMILLVGQVTYVGSTSMEVRVDTFAEELSGERRMINRAYLVLVALDGEGKPTPVPLLDPQTREEKEEWDAGLRRDRLRRQRRAEHF